MADWTIGADSNPQFERSGASTPLIRYFEQSTAASTAAIKYGDVVSNDTATTTKFRIVRAPAGGGNGGNILATTNVLGLASEASTSAGSSVVSKLGVFVAEPDAEYRGFLLGANNVSGSSLIGALRAMRYDSTNHIYGIDSTNSTAALLGVLITDIPDGTEGDTNGPVIFRFLSTWTSPAVRGAF